MSNDIDRILKKSEALCALTGSKLTNKRRNVFTVLLASPIPLSAYEIVDRYKTQFNESLPVMSAYRMLRFLIQKQLVHKLETSGLYMPCAHITCSHQHGASQFLICNHCGTVEEIGIKKHIMAEFERSIQSAGFTVVYKQLELHGVCALCQGHSA